MFFLSEPGENVVQHFLAAQRSSRFSYSDVGESKGGAGHAGYAIDHSRVQLGLGIETFERAKIAIGQWKMFAMPWVQSCWSEAPIRVGTNVAISIPHLGFWSLNAARIVYLVDDSGLCERYGFANGTLLEHGERGEEIFTVEFHTHDGAVWYDLFAFSRPGIVARIAYPLTRSLQKRFSVDSQRAMQDAVKII